MIYLVISLFVVVAVGAFFRQQSKQAGTENENQDAQAIDPASLNLTDTEQTSADEDEQSFILSAKPLTSPELASGATYSAHAPAGEESPYGLSTEPKKKAQAQVNLLRWCGRSGNIQLDNI
ncbi:MAG: hypothetical protein SPK84_05670, partial [Synergistales bacterium]|nr:hypothetical protein [Synergistales bacterium]